MPHPLIVEPRAARIGSDGGEGAAVSPAQVAESLGVMRHQTETYSVGRFRYTSLTDAIAQARRMTKVEGTLV